VRRPPSPLRAILGWSALVADIAATAWFNTSGVELWLKLVVDGLEALGSYTIFVYYLGRLKQFNESSQRPPPKTPAGRSRGRMDEWK
jgi:hypothetical protein